MYQFHMDYVGCKSIYVFYAELDFPASFIWTMWDVNLEMIFVLFLNFEFHMDYVGCKWT